MAHIDLSQSKTRWPLSILLRRGLWTYVLEPLVRWLPKVLSPVRVGALRLMGASIGPRCLILPGVRVLMPWNLILEDHVAIGRGVDFYNFAPITVRRMTVISQEAYLCTAPMIFGRLTCPWSIVPSPSGANAGWPLAYLSALA